MDKISPIAASIKQIAGIDGSNQVQKQSGVDFGKMLKGALGEVNQSQITADKVSQGLATGEVENIHRAVMSIAQADLNFRYVLQVRNKIIDAYQEIMRMQI
jgi:flagellar hook-basal body complex protein FliE